MTDSDKYKLEWEKNSKMKQLNKEYVENRKPDTCPMCGLDKEFQKDDPDNNRKNQCKGCGTKYFNKNKVG